MILDNREYSETQKAGIVAAGLLKDWATAVNGDLIYNHDAPGAPPKRAVPVTNHFNNINDLRVAEDHGGLDDAQIHALDATRERNGDESQQLFAVNAVHADPPLTEAQKAAAVAAGLLKDFALDFRKEIGAPPSNPSPAPPSPPSKDKREELSLVQKAGIVAAEKLKDWATAVNGDLIYDPNAPWSYKPGNTPPSGLPPKDKRQAPQGPPGPTLQKIIEIASNLLVNEVIGALRSQNQVRFVCRNVPVDTLNAQGLEGDLIQQAICAATDEPLLTPAEYQQKTIQLSSDIFITQVIAGVVGKENQQTLCNILDPAQLAMAGLDAGKVKQQVCAAASS